MLVVVLRSPRGSSTLTLAKRNPHRPRFMPSHTALNPHRFLLGLRGTKPIFCMTWACFHFAAFLSFPIDQHIDDKIDQDGPWTVSVLNYCISQIRRAVFHFSIRIPNAACADVFDRGSPTSTIRCNFEVRDANSRETVRSTRSALARPRTGFSTSCRASMLPAPRLVRTSSATACPLSLIHI